MRKNPTAEDVTEETDGDCGCGCEGAGDCNEDVLEVSSAIMQRHLRAMTEAIRKSGMRIGDSRRFR